MGWLLAQASTGDPSGMKKSLLSRDQGLVQLRFSFQPHNFSFTVRLCHVPSASTPGFSMELTTDLGAELCSFLDLSWLQILIYHPLVPPLSNSINGLTVRVALPTENLTTSHIHTPL